MKLDRDDENNINNPYCINCGEDDKFAHGNTYASGTELTCKECGYVFQYEFQQED